ncbi:hypothetical protein E2C01_038592 [Portunus trituberculatus]|uniref:Uncharacterized protein n=1 Tax=Portunus trituberculatus TaxID=210409 RepID=A0A5B7FIC4_PORTR|nr:hypothetical protein [Portunus trituberculatus]
MASGSQKSIGTQINRGGAVKAEPPKGCLAKKERAQTSVSPEKAKGYLQLLRVDVCRPEVWFPRTVNLMALGRLVALAVLRGICRDSQGRERKYPEEPAMEEKVF